MGRNKRLDPCLCLATDPTDGRAKLMVKQYLGRMAGRYMVSTQYDRWKGGEFRMDVALIAEEIYGVVIASYGRDGRLIWERGPGGIPHSAFRRPGHYRRGLSAAPDGGRQAGRPGGRRGHRRRGTVNSRPTLTPGVGQILCLGRRITDTVGGFCGKNSPLERDAAGAPLKKAVFSFCCLIAKGA